MSNPSDTPDPSIPEEPRGPGEDPSPMETAAERSALERWTRNLPPAKPTIPEIALEEGEDLSDPTIRDRLLALTVAHSMAQDAQYSRHLADPMGARTGWKLLSSLVLLLVAALVLIAPPAWLTGPPPPALTTLDRRQGLEAALLLQSLEIDAFRFEKARLPLTLDELDDPDPGVRYVRSNSRFYQLIARDPAVGFVVFDAADPDPRARALAQRWLRRPNLP